jgi:large subunit ribosomal protein L15
MQLVRRLPKRGFNSKFGTVYQAVNLESLGRFPANSTVGPEDLKKAGLISSTKLPIKILGTGNLEKALTLKAHKISGSAKKKLDAAGAKLEVLKT